MIAFDDMFESALGRDQSVRLKQRMRSLSRSRSFPSAIVGEGTQAALTLALPISARSVPSARRTCTLLPLLIITKSFPSASSGEEMEPGTVAFQRWLPLVAS